MLCNEMFLDLLLREDSTKMTGKCWEEAGEQVRQRTLERENKLVLYFGGLTTELLASTLTIYLSSDF